MEGSTEMPRVGLFGRHRMAEMYKEGKTPRQIAEAFKVDTTTVDAHLSAAHVQRRGQTKRDDAADGQSGEPGGTE
jgi:hypothetical protein